MVDYNSAKTTMDDIVFDGRNQTYGAYALRKRYDNYIISAMFIAVAAFVLAVLGPVIWEKIKPKEEIVEEVVVPVDLAKIEPPSIDPKTPPPPPELPQSPPPPKVSTVRFVPPEVAKDEEVVEKDPPKQEDLKKVQAGTETVEGDPNADPTVANLDIPAGNGTGGIVAPVEEEVFTFAEEMPQFPGGDAAMLKFLRENTRYPAQALSREIEGTVYVQFIVGADGKLRDFVVARGVQSSLDEEALKACRKLPDFSPGKQGGRPVTVKMMVPVKFAIAK